MHLLASQSQHFFNYQIQQLELIIYEYISLYLVPLLILEFFLARLAGLPDGNSNVTKLLANLLTKPSVFYYFANCIL